MRVDFDVFVQSVQMGMTAGGWGSDNHYKHPTVEACSACECGDCEIHAAFNPDEPRDEHGKWTAGFGVRKALYDLGFKQSEEGVNNNNKKFEIWKLPKFGSITVLDNGKEFAAIPKGQKTATGTEALLGKALDKLGVFRATPPSDVDAIKKAGLVYSYGSNPADKTSSVYDYWKNDKGELGISKQEDGSVKYFVFPSDGKSYAGELKLDQALAILSESKAPTSSNESIFSKAGFVKGAGSNENQINWEHPSKYPGVTISEYKSLKEFGVITPDTYKSGFKTADEAIAFADSSQKPTAKSEDIPIKEAKVDEPKQNTTSELKPSFEAYPAKLWKSNGFVLTRQGKTSEGKLYDSYEKNGLHVDIIKEYSGYSAQVSDANGKLLEKFGTNFTSQSMIYEISTLKPIEELKPQATIQPIVILIKNAGYKLSATGKTGEKYYDNWTHPEKGVITVINGKGKDYLVKSTDTEGNIKDHSGSSAEAIEYLDNEYLAKQLKPKPAYEVTVATDAKQLKNAGFEYSKSGKDYDTKKPYDLWKNSIGAYLYVKNNDEYETYYSNGTNQQKHTTLADAMKAIEPSNAKVVNPSPVKPEVIGATPVQKATVLKDNGFQVINSTVNEKGQLVDTWKGKNGTIAVTKTGAGNGPADTTLESTDLLGNKKFHGSSATDATTHLVYNAPSEADLKYPIKRVQSEDIKTDDAWRKSLQDHVTELVAKYKDDVSKTFYSSDHIVAWGNTYNSLVNGGEKEGKETLLKAAEGKGVYAEAAAKAGITPQQVIDSQTKIVGWTGSSTQNMRDAIYKSSSNDEHADPGLVLEYAHTQAMLPKADTIKLYRGMGTSYSSDLAKQVLALKHMTAFADWSVDWKSGGAESWSDSKNKAESFKGDGVLIAEDVPRSFIWSSIVTNPTSFSTHAGEREYVVSPKDKILRLSKAHTEIYAAIQSLKKAVKFLRSKGWTITVDAKTKTITVQEPNPEINWLEKLRGPRVLGEEVLKANHKLEDEYVFQGLPIAVENKKGSTRSGTQADGSSWSVEMPFDYGYVKGTKGVDGDAVDVFIGPDKDAKYAYVIHQNGYSENGDHHNSGEYDEDKCMLGFDSAMAAERAYRSAYKNADLFHGMTMIPMHEFIEKVNKTRDMKKPHKIHAELCDAVTELLAGGPGSGCHGPNCGRPKSGEVFVSPNTKEGTKLDYATKALQSRKHKDFISKASNVVGKLAKSGKVNSALGVWKDGAENSSEIQLTGKHEFQEYIAALLGKYAKQKAVLHWEPNPHGDHSLYTIESNQSMKDMHSKLAAAGIDYHTLVPNDKEGNTRAVVLDTDNSLGSKIGKLSQEEGYKTTRRHGKGNFIGSWDSREEGDKAYSAIIRRFEKANPKSAYSRSLGLAAGGIRLRAFENLSRWIAKEVA